MSFIVQCPYCKVRAPVPDRAVGGSGQCPRCGNSFTLAPEDDQSAPASAAEPTSSELEPMAETAVATAIAEASESAKEADALAAAQEDAALDDEQPLSLATPLADAPSRLQTARLAGATALLCGGFAFVCGTMPSLCFLVTLVSGIGLTAGLVGVGLALTVRRRRLVLPLAGAAFCAAMLIAAWAFPAMLGPNYQRHAATRRGPREAPTGAQPAPIEPGPPAAPSAKPPK